ncbi:cytochrome P450 [Nocardia beijingensis]|uniref:cytochrome P450 n=1 Tax=Nocardia beijingensis TaxID=95162 RepID=UPI0033AD7C9B
MSIETASGRAVLPPGPRGPGILPLLGALVARDRTVALLTRRYGPTFTVRVPILGPAVVISDSDLIKQVFQAKSDVVERPVLNLGEFFGPGSLFSLEGERHQERRKLLVPPLHGRRMREYEGIVEEETRNEVASWPEGEEFAVLPSMMRITLDIILRAVFGAEDEELSELRVLLPDMVAIGSRLASSPVGRVLSGPLSPRGRLERRRRRFREIVRVLIDKAQADPNLEDREDILSLLLLARYDDGSAMSYHEIGDELLTLLAAGHETTATTLAWATERARRHPAVLRRLAEEADTEGAAYRYAFIQEVQRVRPVIQETGRRVVAPSMQLGQWTLPQGCTILVDIRSAHRGATGFPHAGLFDPDRFLDAAPDVYSWVPFGGGRRRCIGAAFATMEMNVVLRTLLREFEIGVTDAPAERNHHRGVASAPADGGRILVRRRARQAIGANTAP